MNIEQISDTIEIQNLGYRFADSANHKNFAEFVSLWPDDGVWHIGPPINVHFEKKEIIGKAIEHMLGLWDFFVQMPHAPVIEFTSSTSAKARWTVLEEARAAEGVIGNYNLSFYHDELVKVSGTWLFKKREYITRYQDNSAFKGMKFELEEIANAKK